MQAVKGSTEVLVRNVTTKTCHLSLHIVWWTLTPSVSSVKYKYWKWFKVLGLFVDRKTCKQMCNACILSRFVYIFTNKPTWLEYTEKKKTWQLWILFCPVRDIKYVEVLRSFSTDLETSNELFRSAVGLSNAGSFRSWKRENSRSNDFIGVSDQLLHSCIIIIILVYCKRPKTHCDALTL